MLNSARLDLDHVTFFVQKIGFLASIEACFYLNCYFNKIICNKMYYNAK